MKHAAKQLLSLGVAPHEITTLDARAESEGVTLRELVQKIIHDAITEREVTNERPVG